jgi:hypothetical protein
MEEALEDRPKPAKIKGAYTARDVIKQQYCSLVFYSSLRPRNILASTSVPSQQFLTKWMVVREKK